MINNRRFNNAVTYRKDIGHVLHNKGLWLEIFYHPNKAFIQLVSFIVNDALTGYRKTLARRSSYDNIYLLSIQKIFYF